MRVLIIEDDMHIRNNMVEILEIEEYEAIAVSNGKDGVQAVQNQHPDIIFCDLMMPDMDGFAVLEKIKEHPDTKNIPFVFVTARTERELVEKGMSMGAMDFLLKPFTTDTILNMLKSMR